MRSNNESSKAADFRCSRILAGGLLALGLTACGASTDVPDESSPELGKTQEALTAFDFFPAEDASFDGTVESEHAGFIGVGYVNSADAVGASIEWTVPADAAGPALLDFRYANGSGNPLPVDIVVNGVTVTSGFTFVDTGAWATWAVASEVVELAAGSNTIELVATTDEGGPNYDQLNVFFGETEVVSLALPISGQAGADWVINAYFDHNPEAGQVADYTGGFEASDGHIGTDFDIPSFRQMDDDSAQVLAVAPGTVTLVEDTNFDRETSLNDNPPNVIQIQHQGDLVSRYLHLKQNSAVVSVGDSVTAGQVLAVAGSSGNSTQPHLHLELIRDFSGPADPFSPNLWSVDPPAYDLPLSVMDFMTLVGGFGQFPLNLIKDPVPNQTVMTTDQTIGIGLSLAGGDGAMSLAVRMLRPDGSTLDETTLVPPDGRHSFASEDFFVASGEPTGTYQLQVLIEGQVVESIAITVTEAECNEPPIVVSVPDDIVTSDCEGFLLPVPTFEDPCGGDNLSVRGAALGMRIDPGDSIDLPIGTTVVDWDAINEGGQTGVSYTVTCVEETTCNSATLEAEDMDHAVGGAAPEGWNIWSNGDISTTHDFTAGPNTITIRARGEAAQGVFPHMVVSVGGTPIGDVTVSSAEFADYEFSFVAGGGPQVLSIAFDNDFFAPPEDRNLIVDHAIVDCPAAVGISVELPLFTDWGAGYCMGIWLTNEGTEATTSWQAVIDMQGTQISNLWNANFTSTTGQVTLTPLSWNSVINPGETNQSIGFCATRPAGGNALATVVSATAL